MRYEPALDLDSIRAIDVHVHIEHDDHGHAALPHEVIEAANAYFKRSAETPGLDAIAEAYRARSMAAVVFTVDATTAMGVPPNSSIEVAESAARHNDVLIPFGSVDPLQGDAAKDMVKRLVEDHGVMGFKFHPSVQGFDPSDGQYEPLFELIADYGLPTIFHTGQTGIGAGMPGGFGIRLALSNPLLLDELACRVRHLKIIMAHPSVPWQDEAISIATHKANTWIDLSGWSPKYFPANLVQAARTYLQDKVLFGTDFPAITPERWLQDWERLDLPATVRKKIEKTNAIKMLGLDEKKLNG